MTLANDILHYARKERKFFPPYLWDKLSVEPAEFTTALCEIWHLFKNPCVIDDYVVTEAPNERFVYEVCNTKYERGKYIEETQLYEWCKRNQKRDQHHSIVTHDTAWLNHVAKTGTVGRVYNSRVKMNELYIELDRKGDKAPLKKAMLDAFVIRSNAAIAPYTSVFFSGNKSVHISINGGLFGTPIGRQDKLCGRGRLIYNLQQLIAQDVRFGNGMVDVWNEPSDVIINTHKELYGYVIENDIPTMRQHLENCDPSLCSVNSLIRAPFSWHEKGNKQKTLLNDVDLLLGMTSHNIADWRVKAPPLLLHLYYQALEPTYKKKRVACNASSSYICEVFAKHIPDFDETEATAEGYVNGLYSPFYEDENPSVGVNIETGFYKDFGNIDHTFTFVEFLARVENITLEQATKLIDENE